VSHFAVHLLFNYINSKHRYVGDNPAVSFSRATSLIFSSLSPSLSFPGQCILPFRFSSQANPPVSQSLGFQSCGKTEPCRDRQASKQAGKQASRQSGRRRDVTRHGQKSKTEKFWCKLPSYASRARSLAVMLMELTAKKKRREGEREREMRHTEDSETKTQLRWELSFDLRPRRLASGATS